MDDGDGSSAVEEAAQSGKDDAVAGEGVTSEEGGAARGSDGVARGSGGVTVGTERPWKVVSVPTGPEGMAGFRTSLQCIYAAVPSGVVLPGKL